jgi:hypothetical protein
MKYMFLTYLDEKEWDKLGEKEQQKRMAECEPHVRQLLRSGKFLAGSPLDYSSTGATVRLRKGKPLITDGPFAETREQVAGYTLIEAESLEEATKIATGFLGTRSQAIIEVRKIAEIEGLPSDPKARKNAKRRGLRLAAVALVAISMGVSVRQAATSQPVARFLTCYQAMRSADAPISFWERVAYSLALSRACGARTSACRETLAST